MATRPTKKKKKVPAKKKASKKKASKKRSSKKKPPPAVNLPAVAEDEEPAPPDSELQVWESYRRLRSRMKVADELGISERQVRNVLEADASRVRRILDGYAELIASDRELIERRGLDIIYRLLAIFDRYLVRIELAEADMMAKNQADGVVLIEGPNGQLMTVMQATEYMLGMRGFGQLVDGLMKLRKDINDYRAPQAGGPKDAAPAGDELDNFGDMDPAQLAEILEAGGAPLPGVLGRLRKYVKSTTRQTL